MALYETVAEPLDARARRRGRDYLTFTSSSTVRFFLAGGRRARRRARASSRSGRSPARRCASTASSRTWRPRATTSTASSTRSLARRRPRIRDRSRCLTDYGRDDDFVGVCHGGHRARSARRRRSSTSPTASRRHDVRPGALVLRARCPTARRACTSRSSTREVGAERRAVALRARRRAACSSAPTTACSRLAAERLRRRGEAVDVAPLAAPARARVRHVPRPRHLRAGRRRASPAAPPLADAGDPLDPTSWSRLELPQPRVDDGAVVAHVLVIDRSATLRSTSTRGPGGDRHHARRHGGARGGRRALPATYAQTFADVSPGELIVYEDAYRTLAVAINRGDAAATLALRPDASCGCGLDDRAAADPPPADRLDERAGAGARRRGRAARHAGHGRRAEAGRGRQGRAWTAPRGRRC